MELSKFSTSGAGLMLSKNHLIARFFWNLKSSMKTTSVNGVERYICLFDVVDMGNMKCYRYFTSLVSTRRKAGVWEKTNLTFISASENSPVLQEFFYQLFESVKNTELYQFSEEEMNERLSIFPQHCFTLECLRVLFTLFYDYYSFEKAVFNACKCGKFLSGMCDCLHLFASSIRSFYFVEMENKKLDGVIYEYIDSEFINKAIDLM